MNKRQQLRALHAARHELHILYNKFPASLAAAYCRWQELRQARISAARSLRRCVRLHITPGIDPYCDTRGVLNFLEWAEPMPGAARDAALRSLMGAQS